MPFLLSKQLDTSPTFLLLSPLLLQDTKHGIDLFKDLPGVCVRVCVCHYVSAPPGRVCARVCVTMCPHTVPGAVIRQVLPRPHI